jgi:hypothetical protein
VLQGRWDGPAVNRLHFQPRAVLIG